MTASLRALGKPRSFEFVGDSHVGVFNGLLFESAARPGEFLVTKSYYQPFFRAAHFYRDGRFPEAMTRTLLQMRWIETTESDDDACEAFTPVEVGGAEPVRFRPVPRRAGRVAIVSAGEVDAFDLGHELLPRFDIEVDSLPDALDRLAPYDAAETLGMAAASDLVAARMAPLYHGLAVLRDLGFEDLFLLGMPPPGNVEDERWRPARFRYKLRLLMNRVSHDWCARNGVGFVARWDALTREGLRDPALDRDGIHVNEEAAAITVSAIEEELSKRV